MKTVKIDYGRTGMDLKLPSSNVTILRPHYPKPLLNEAEAFKNAVNNPLGDGRPLKERIKASDRLAIVIPDVTRALPNRRLLDWLLAEIPDLPSENVTIISGTGTHRPNTPDEWRAMVGKPIFETYTCIDHRCDEKESLVFAGQSGFGYPVHYNRAYVEADRRIILGFIEPHFMAGFSGGFKAIFPGVTDVDAIMNYHSAQNIGHPKSSWGIIDGNPTQAHVRAGGSLLPVDFCINVTLDNQLRITGFFCGDTLPGHDAGCAFCKSTAMVPCEHPFPVVITSNSGYPLDQNLYQCVKGMSAAAQIVQEGGLILMAGACNDGFPEHGNFRRMLATHTSPKAILEEILSPGFRCCDQWQVQILATILGRARVGLFSELSPGEVREAHLEPVEDLDALIDSILSKDPETPIAILPEGPLTIPYLA